MHGTTQTAIETRRPGKNFRQRAIEKKVARQVFHTLRALLFDHTQTVASQKRLHYRLKVIILHFTDGRGSFGENLAMGTV